MQKKTQLISFSYDFLSIYDGDSSTSYILGEYCGNSIPPSSVSSNNEVLIHFYSNGYGAEAGFKMEYNPIGKTHQFKTTLNNMGIIIEKYGSTIQSALSALFCFLNICASINFFNNNVYLVT